MGDLCLLVSGHGLLLQLPPEDLPQRPHGKRAAKLDAARPSFEALTDKLPASDSLAGQEADLIVMGAYGHSRWAERLFAGVSRTLLQSMTVPVLMSH